MSLWSTTLSLHTSAPHAVPGTRYIVPNGYAYTCRNAYACTRVSVPRRFFYPGTRGPRHLVCPVWLCLPLGTPIH
eukprot:527144-Rhodomonas_salina.3